MAFPKTRLRRMRATETHRRMVRETRLSVDNLIYPLFVVHGRNVKREISSMPGVFQLSTDNIIREAKEEVNIKITPNDIDIVTVCHSYNPKNNKEFIQFYAICKRWQGEIKNNEPEKCGELKFFSLNALPKNMVLYVRDGIIKTMNGIRYYEYGWHGEL